MLSEDTIAAVATAPGDGAIGIVRVSGPETLQIAGVVVGRTLLPRHATYATFRHPRDGRVLDEGLAVFMPGPASYTGEDVLELQGHGGRRSILRLLEGVLSAGARAAEPGEFTLRAFLAGRMDLTQAESVLALVEARTDVAADLALDGLAGHLGGRLRAARLQALEILAYLSARADFPDEDVPLRALDGELDALHLELRGLLAGADFGILHREGVRVVIAGPPNAGKSSLLNLLLGQERAIVTQIAGTTRDTIEEAANVLGLPVVFTDTAGMRVGQDSVERLGISRSLDAVSRADLVLLVLDGSTPMSAEELASLGAFTEIPLLVVLNKSDLGRALPEAQLEPLGAAPNVVLSALTGDGVDELRRLIYDVCVGGDMRPPAYGALSTVRQKAVAERAAAHVAAAVAGYASGAPEDLLSVDLQAAVHALGELTGEDATEDLLDTIFSRFCIGK